MDSSVGCLLTKKAVTFIRHGTWLVLFLAIDPSGPPRVSGLQRSWKNVTLSGFTLALMLHSISLPKSPNCHTVLFTLLRRFLELKSRNFHLAWRFACPIPCKKSTRTAAHLFPLRPATQLEECDFVQLLFGFDVAQRFTRC